ncbi:MAG: hypothetical protein MUF38_00830 [Anaerolineae bacterium]|nr:hypothetical protein [Anaerolineae bacterium]
MNSHAVTPARQRRRDNLRRAVLVLAFILSACRAALTPPAAKLPMTVPYQLIAGQSVTVQVGPTDAADGTDVGLVMVGSLGPRVYQSTFIRGIATFVIPGEHTLQTGTLAFVAAAEAARGEAGLILRTGARFQMPGIVVAWAQF